MAITVTRYRSTNPGQFCRYFDVTALDGDTTATFAHNCSWTPDRWSFFTIDGTGAMYIGRWVAQVNATTVVITKNGAASSGSLGNMRLVLYHLAIRP